MAGRRDRHTSVKTIKLEEDEKQPMIAQLASW